MNKTRFQRIIAVALSLLLLISAAPLTAFAQDGSEMDWAGLKEALVTNYAKLTAAEARYAELTKPAQPTKPDDDGLCKWCGEDHSGNFWQRIVGFWHTVFYFWAHLFGLK